MPALVKAEKGLDCPSGKVLVSVLGSGEDSVDVDLFVVPWRGPGRPMGLNKGWKGQDNRGLKVTKLSGSCDPRVVDYFRPFGGEGAGEIRVGWDIEGCCVRCCVGYG